MSESLLYDEIQMWKEYLDCYTVKSEGVLKTSDDSDISYFVEIDLSYLYDIKQKN